MIDIEQRKQLLRFLKAGDSVIITVTGREYKLSQSTATELYDTFLNTGWITTEEFQINQGHVASTERDGSGSKKSKVSSNGAAAQ